MSDLIILSVIIAFFVLGLTRPYIAFAGYLWMDMVVPQNILFGFLAGKPLSMVMAVLCFLSLAFNFNRLTSPKVTAVPFYFAAFLAWITITTFFIAYYPTFAYIKWDWAFKSLLMAFLMMFVIKERDHLDTILWVLFFSINFYVLSAGLKTLGGGGGYGARLIVGSGNSGWGESSTLAMLVLFNLPLGTHLMRHMSFFSDGFKKPFLWYGLGALTLLAMIGTTARTAFIALAGYIGYRNVSFWRVLLVLPFVVFVGIALFPFLPMEFQERLLTLQDIQNESSAMGRVVVWLWTIDFVKDAPLGGGFESYIAHKGILGRYHESFINYHGVKAFHSVYFEVLGEQGFVGLFLFLSILYGTYRLNRQIMKTEAKEGYHYSVAYCFNSMILIFCLGGLFIGVAYKPLIYYIVSMTVAHYSFWKLNNEQNETAV